MSALMMAKYNRNMWLVCTQIKLCSDSYCVYFLSYFHMHIYIYIYIYIYTHIYTYICLCYAYLPLSFKGENLREYQKV